MTTTAGSIHTQWCDHDTGDTTNPNSATQTSAKIGSPAASTRRAAHHIAASTSRHPASHSTERTWSFSGSRARAPARFWLVFRLAPPMRSVSLTVCVQYCQESLQAITKPTRVAARNDATVVTAARRSRRNRKYSRKTAGVSLSATATQQRAARPVGAPRHTVGDHQRHQHRIDLAEVEVGPDRFGI